MQSKIQRQIKEIPVVPPANILSCAKVVRYQIVKCVYFQTFLQISWGIVYSKFYPCGFSFSTFDYRYFKLITIFTGKYKLLEPQKCPHNPETVGSSPASATKIIPDFDMKSGIFLTFCANSHWLQICFGDSLGRAQNHGWEKPNFFIENGFSVNSAIFSPQTPPPGHPRLLSPGQHRWQSWLRTLCAGMREGGYGAGHCPG